MDRRQFSQRSIAQAAVWALAPLLIAGGNAAHALSLSELSQADATRGLRTALERGSLAAIGLLGRTDGFLGNAKVRIPLPAYLEDASKLLKALGQGPRLDELVTSMNRAAEAAVPLAKTLLTNAVRNMSVADAKSILSGSDTSVTQFFADKTREPLFAQFLPVVARSVDRVGLAVKYNRVASQAANFGLIGPQDATIQQHVTGKALDGLYWVIGEQERALRQDPVGSGSAILRKVFGALK